MNPIVVLIRPQLGENIGAAARAMANFGLRQMRLVAPRDGWPNPKAADMAGRALDILDDAQLFATPQEAVADCEFVLATTARARAGTTPVLDPRAAMEKLRRRQAAGQRCAILFGPERTGLENEEVTLADAVVTIPVSADYPSLNLAQAVVVLMYEWFAGREVIEPPPETSGQPAPRQALFGLFAQLEQALDEVNFWRVPEKKEIMWRHLRATLMRAELTSAEIATWRGIIRALHEGEKVKNP
jgi:tRNA/rRNA methyltransferase